MTGPECPVQTAAMYPSERAHLYCPRGHETGVVEQFAKRSNAHSGGMAANVANPHDQSPGPSTPPRRARLPTSRSVRPAGAVTSSIRFVERLPLYSRRTVLGHPWSASRGVGVGNKTSA